MNKYSKQAQQEWINPAKPTPTKGDLLYMALTLPLFGLFIVYLVY